MNGDIQRFEFPYTGAEVRVFEVGGEPWFVAADVARILGYRMASDMTRRLDDDEKGTHSTRTPGGLQEMAVISEPGLYTAVLGSQVSGAKEFKRWVTREVLPAIRRTGSYSVQPQFEIPRTYADALELAARQARAIEKANERIGELEQPAHAWNVLASAHGDYSVREAAFILNRDPAISTGQNRLFKTLREFGLIDGKDVPYASHERHVTLRSRHFEHPRTGEKQLTQQVRITVEGLRYLHKKLGGTAPFSSLIGDAA